VYLNAALAQLKTQGYPVLEEDAARLSPFVRKHLGVYLDKLQICYVAGPASSAARPVSVIHDTGRSRSSIRRLVRWS